MSINTSELDKLLKTMYANDAPSRLLNYEDLVRAPQTPYRGTSIVSNDGGEKIKEFKEFLLEMKRDLKEGYDISMLDIIDKFDETFEEE